MIVNADAFAFYMSHCYEKSYMDISNTVRYLEIQDVCSLTKQVSLYQGIAYFILQMFVCITVRFVLKYNANISYMHGSLDSVGIYWYTTTPAAFDCGSF